MRRVVTTDSEQTLHVSNVNTRKIYIGFDGDGAEVIFHRYAFGIGDYRPSCITDMFTAGNGYEGGRTLGECISKWVNYPAREVFEFDTFQEAAKYITENS